MPHVNLLYVYQLLTRRMFEGLGWQDKLLDNHADLLDRHPGE